MRRVALLAAAVAALVAAAPGWAANVTLRADHRVARYDDMVRLRGLVASAAPLQVSLLRNGVIVRSTVANGGGFFFDLHARQPGSFAARTALGNPAPIALVFHPRLKSRIVGRRLFGHRVFVVGRLLPARAGRLVLGRAPVRGRPSGVFPGPF